MKRAAMSAVALFVLLSMLSACSSKLDNVYHSSVPTSEAAFTAADTAGGALPTPTALSGGVEENYEILDAGLKELFSNAAYVVLVDVQADGVEWNAARDENDMSKPRDDIFLMEVSYPVKIVESFKGGLKKDDTIHYNIAYREKYSPESEYIMDAAYHPVEKGKRYLLFLQKDPDFDDIYYVNTQPHCFELQGDKLFLHSAIAGMENWNNGVGTSGIDYAQAKTQMGVR